MMPCAPGPSKVQYRCTKQVTSSPGASGPSSGRRVWGRRDRCPAPASRGCWCSLRPDRCQSPGAPTCNTSVITRWVSSEGKLVWSDQTKYAILNSIFLPKHLFPFSFNVINNILWVFWIHVNTKIGWIRGQVHDDGRAKYRKARRRCQLY